MYKYLIGMLAILTNVAFAGVPVELSGATQPTPVVLYGEKLRYVPIVDCKDPILCELRGVGFRMARIERSTSPKSKEYGTVMYAWYDTANMSSLENFVFVQFMRGCFFETNTYKGKTTKHYIKILNNGKMKPFCFKDWVIDRDYTDPAYSSEPGFSRHHYAQWLSEDATDSFSEKFIRNYGDEKPKSPRLGIFDRHDNATVMHWPNGRIRGSSALLEFRTCLFRTKDVPEEFDELKDTLPPPIICHEWQTGFHFDPQADKIKEVDNPTTLCEDQSITIGIEELRWRESVERGVLPLAY